MARFPMFEEFDDKSPARMPEDDEMRVPPAGAAAVIAVSVAYWNSNRG